MTEVTKSRIYRTVIVVLLLVIAGMAYKFIFAGSTAAGDDQRVAVILDPGERALMLREMREFVGSVQGIVDALSREDMKAVAVAARRMGMARSHDVPAGLMGKLPLEFKALALGVHRGFDAMAMDAESIGMPRHTLEQLSAALQQCVACHARYQVKEAPVRNR
ncbi:MAG: hypothetical protein IT518_16145 [Burkholderiales bacterium]|nr:hypothetical protein [Burkholderiales bacterium]